MNNEFTDTELAGERWKAIEGYENIYEVSSLGRVRSKHSGEWKVLSARKNNNGYLCVGLCKDGKKKKFLVHRLVAQAFIPNSDETKTIINHKNECKDFNNMDNLEWCTVSYNNTYNDLPFRKKNSVRRKIEKLYDPKLSIKQNLEIFRANGIECCEDTVTELRKELGLARQFNICSKIKDIYDPNLSITENIEIFKAKGIECSKKTVLKLRKELGLTKPRELKRDKIKPLYRPDLSIKENIAIFKENGVECSEWTVKRLRKDLGLTNPK